MPAGSESSRNIDGREQRMLNSVCADGLSEVTVHLASSTEDALNTCRRGGGSEVLLDHLAEVGPLGLLCLPPLQQLDVEVDVLRIRRSAR